MPEYTVVLSGKAQKQFFVLDLPDYTTLPKVDTYADSVNIICTVVKCPIGLKQARNTF